MKTLFEKPTAPVDLLIFGSDDEATLQVFRGGREITTLRGRRATVEAIARDRFGESPVRRLNPGEIRP